MASACIACEAEPGRKKSRGIIMRTGIAVGDRTEPLALSACLSENFTAVRTRVKPGLWRRASGSGALGAVQTGHQRGQLAAPAWLGKRIICAAPQRWRPVGSYCGRQINQACHRCDTRAQDVRATRKRFASGLPPSWHEDVDAEAITEVSAATSIIDSPHPTAPEPGARDLVKSAPSSRCGAQSDDGHFLTAEQKRLRLSLELELEELMLVKQHSALLAHFQLHPPERTQSARASPSRPQKQPPPRKPRPRQKFVKTTFVRDIALQLQPPAPSSLHRCCTHRPQAPSALPDSPPTPQSSHGSLVSTATHKALPKFLTMVTQMDQLPQVPPPGTSPRSSNSWSRCDQAVARVAPIATTTCQVCSSCIAQGEWQLGLMFIHAEGFMLMEWYHLQCSKSLQGSGLSDVLQTVQSEMTPTQKQEFQLACQKA